MKNVLVFVQHKNAQTPKVTFEMATQARALADHMPIMLGSGGEQMKRQPVSPRACRQ